MSSNRFLKNKYPSAFEAVKCNAAFLQIVWAVNFLEMYPLQIIINVFESGSDYLIGQFLICVLAFLLIFIPEIRKMERQYGKDATFLKSSFRFFQHHKTMKTIVDLLFSVKHIRVNNQIKGAVFKIMAVVFPSHDRSYATDILFSGFLIDVIQALSVNVSSVHFTLLIKSICGCKRIIPGSAAVIQNNRVFHIKDRSDNLCSFSLLPVIYFIENIHFAIYHRRIRMPLCF